MYGQEGKAASLSLHDSNGRILLSFRWGNLSLGTDGDHYSIVNADGMSLDNGLPGQPALPSLSKAVLLPRGSRLSLESLHGEETPWGSLLDRDRPLRPVAEATAKDATPPDIYPDKETYSADRWFRGGEPLEVTHLGTLGNHEVFRLTVRPMAYHPLQRSLRLYTTLDATLTASLGTLPAGLDLLPPRYLVVSRPEFEEGLQPFLRWKRQQGYAVEALYVETHQRDSIRAAIADRWTVGGQRPDYLLLVGDAAQIQSFIGTTYPFNFDSHTTDLYYAEHTGDYLPDTRLGRWPVNDTAELGRVVHKTLRYELALDLDSLQLSRMLLVAGHDTNAPAPVTTNGQVNYVSREVKRLRPWMDTTVFRNHESDQRRGDILSAIGQGVTMVNYTAHCTTAGWSHPAVSYSSIDTLNEGQPMVYVNNCCKSNTFSGTGFGEQLLRKAHGGAVAVIGATNSTLWNEDYYWSVGPKYPFTLQPAYDSLLQGAFDRLLAEPLDAGALVQAGNLAVTAFGSPYDKFYWEIYCLLGDPSLVPWFGMPQPLSLRVTEAPHNGDGSLSLEATPGATVTALQHDSVAGRGIVGNDGTLTLSLNRTLDTTPLLLTATSYGFRPHIDTLAVAPAHPRSATLRDIRIGDSTVSFLIENTGTLPLYGLQATLQQHDGDTLYGALLLMQSLSIDTLLPAQQSSSALPVLLSRPGTLPYWKASLVLRDSEGTLLCSVALHHLLSFSVPTATYRLLEADGSEAHRLLPQHSYLMETILDSPAEGTSLTLTALPATDPLATTTTYNQQSTLPFLTPDSLTHLRIATDLTLLGYTRHSELFLVAGPRTESFEEGFSSYPWQSPSLHPWVIDSTVSYSGHLSARSGAIGNRQASDLQLEVLLPQPDTLTYRVRTSCETQYDKFQFFLDDKLIGYEAWGESGWEQRHVLIGAGHHTLRWRYVKDESTSAGNDCVWIDDLQLPLALWDSAYGWFSDSPLGLQPASPSPHPTLHPNPSRGRMTVTVPGDGILRLTDLCGRLLMPPTTVHPGSVTLTLDHLPDGLYLLLYTDQYGTDIQKLLINR